ncbi:MAG: ATP-binding protein [Oscillospiraceae bacterium]|nr:ATP-binding protein [Oscillospiraceae bacterium]
MFVGNKNLINLSSSRFANFIKNGYLYIDKTAFIEHIMQDPSEVLLFARPRRMGKSLNMDTLATFLDCTQNTTQLFKGLYIEHSAAFCHANKYPVIYLDFANLDAANLETLQKSFRGRILNLIQKLLDIQNLSLSLKEYANDPKDYSPSVLGLLIEAVFERYAQEPFLIIDEYDKVIIDTLNDPKGNEIKSFIVTALQSALKGRTHFKKSVLTGVTRTTKENLFSGLNNVVAYDIFTPSVYDSDFSLTEEELVELVPENEITGVREWYNNMRVGGVFLYNIYSVMNYLNNPKAGLKAYWARTGSEILLSKLMNDQRAETITCMMENRSFEYEAILDCQLNMEHLKDNAHCTDTSFYTLATQAGYLSFNPTESNISNIFIPNKEAKSVWARLVLDFQYKGADMRLIDIFKKINETDLFSQQLTEFTSMVLSYNDFKSQDEWVYHVFFLGLVYSLGYECKSNLEAGLGRFDIFLKTRKFNAIIEFKVAKSPSDNALAKEADKALKQIADKEYWHISKNSTIPLYKIGIACHGKKCLVKTVLHV